MPAEPPFLHQLPHLHGCLGTTHAESDEQLHCHSTTTFSRLQTALTSHFLVAWKSAHEPSHVGFQRWSWSALKELIERGVIYHACNIFCTPFKPSRQRYSSRGSSMAVKERSVRSCISAANIYDQRRRSIRLGSVSTEAIDRTSDARPSTTAPSSNKRRMTRQATKFLKQNQSFLLLDLPTEVKLRVYKHIEVEALRASRHTDGLMASTSQMIYVNRNIGGDVVNEQHRTVDIRMEAVDFDFRLVVSMLKRHTCRVEISEEGHVQLLSDV